MATHLILPPLSSRIAIIGAGAAGLCTACIFRRAGYSVTVYEAADDIGGTWSYSPTPSPTSALYQSLRCNIPKQVMAFSDLPFPPHVPSFPSHTDTLEYLRSYAAKHNLRDCCEFNQRVASIAKAPQRTPENKWRLRTEQGGEHQYDAVIVCNGHYAVPNPWRPRDTDAFLTSGRTFTHSRMYRVPAPYTNRRVLVVGRGPSGIDIALELSKHASAVFLSHSKQIPSVFANNPQEHLSEVPAVVELTRGGDAKLIDGSIVQDIDDVVACTGYVYDFPFLKPNAAGVNVSSDGRAVHGLLRQCVAEKDTTLAFIGLPLSIIPFPLFEDQAHFLVALYSGRIKGRALDNLLQEGEQERLDEKMKAKEFHRLRDGQWEYRRQLTSLAGRPPLPPSTVEIYRNSSAALKRDPSKYRERVYHLLGPGPFDWRVFVNGEDITGREDPSSP